MKKSKRPNILLIYTDQQRFDSIRANGNPYAITPNLDSLIKSGVNFENYFVNNPVCMPSRMSFLTGKTPGQLGIGDNGIPLSQDETTINKILDNYGYITAQIGKLHFLPHVNRRHNDIHPNYGFDICIISDEPGCYDDAYIKWVESVDPSQVKKVRCGIPTEGKHYNQPVYSEKGRSPHQPYVFEGDEDLTHSAFVADNVSEFLREQSNNREPFFAIAGFYAPHAPLNPPKRFLDMYDINDMPLPSKTEYENDFLPKSYKDLSHITDEKWKEVIASYLALTTHVDDCVGKIINTLKEEDLYNDTIIIFTSDHGEFLGDHGRVHKGMPGHDCVSNVPLIINYGENIEGGKVINDLVEAIDIMPTILDYCKIQKPSYMQGESLKPLIEGNKEYHRDSIFIEFFEPYGLRENTLRNEKFKYYINSDGHEILFDLEKDPKELNNVVNDVKYKEILSELRKDMIIRIQKSAYQDKDKTAPY